MRKQKNNYATTQSSTKRSTITTTSTTSSSNRLKQKDTYSLVRGTYGIRTLRPDHLVIGEERWVWVVSETQADPVGTSIHY